MNARVGIICALLAAMPNLVGCESSRSQDYQFEKQVKRAQECRQLQDKLVGNQPLTPERAEEIAKTMDQTGCDVPPGSPPTDAGVPRPRIVAQAPAYARGIFHSWCLLRRPETQDAEAARRLWEISRRDPTLAQLAR